MISADEAKTLQCAMADRPCRAEECMAWAAEVAPHPVVKVVPVNRPDVTHMPVDSLEMRPTGRGYCLMIPNPHKEYTDGTT